MPTAITATFINAIVLVLIEWRVVEHALLIVWLIGIFVITAARAATTIAYRRARLEQQHAPRWERYFLVGSVLAAMAWGSASFILFPDDSIIHQVFLAFIVGGMCAGAVTTLSSLRIAVLSFLILALGPLIFRFFMSDSEIAIAMAGMLLLFLMLISSNALKTCRSTMQNIVLRLESADREAAIRISEEKLRESEKTYHGIFNSLEEAVYIQNAQGRFLDVNEGAVRMYGYPRERFIGQTVDFLSAPGRNDMDMLKSRVEKAFAGESQQLEYWGRRADGQIFEKDVRLYPGEYFGQQVIIAVAQDVSDKRHLEAQLLQSQKMEALGTLVGGIAHDFNNTLAGITGNLYLVSRQSGDRPEVLARLKGVEKLCFRAADMVNQLLTFARKDMVDMHPLLLKPFIKEAFSLSKVSIPENIKIRSIFCKEALNINGDATQLQQVLMNLLNNARDALAGHAKPEIVIKVEAVEADEILAKKFPDLTTHRLAKLTVSDNGRGISEEYLENIFEPFFTTKGVGEGTGLGLAMVYGAIQSHGGVIQVESVPGKGTAFHIYLPLLDAEFGVSIEKDERVIPGRGEIILLADDEAHVRQTGKAVLESLGYTVLEAADGEAAVALFRSRCEQIALTILDVVMPKMGGIEAAKKIREIKPDMPIICATGYGKADVLAASCCELVLAKPYTVKTLSQCVHQLLTAEK
ncbi:MAG: ATP-binding protein [Mariprofundaceae bacterium]|nr:ATP-binding protein [Mariprofundaceae bacterium]